MSQFIADPPPAFNHQAEDHAEFGHMDGYARFWEQGVGKTRPTIDDMAEALRQDRVDASLVLAPNGVHSNWVRKEWSVHTPLDVRDRVRLFEYQSDKASTKKFQNELKSVLYGNRVPWVAMSYDSLMTKAGLKVAQFLLKRKKCFLTADEAHRIKEPSAKRTKRVLAAAKWAKMRRALTGTPVANSPFDVYTIMKFLDENFWLPYNLSTFTTFKAQFGVFGPAFRAGPAGALSNCVGYQHLDVLADAISSHSSRWTKESAGLDLPPKLYSTRSHDLSPEQRRVYEQLKEELIAEMDEGEITADLVLVQLLRLQQITCGHVGLDDGTVQSFEPNPRAKLLLEVLKDIPHKAIVFCRFKEDVNAVMKAARQAGKRVGRYDGETGDAEREDTITRFQDLPASEKGALDLIAANSEALSEGRTLTAAKTVVYYSNSFKLTTRLQTEDRAHRIGQDRSVHYIDLECPNTIDQKLVTALRKKRDLSDKVLGDDPREWI